MEPLHSWSLRRHASDVMAIKYLPTAILKMDPSVTLFVMPNGKPSYYSSLAGLPDGLFSNQKLQFG
jgi:hypothetical protein